MKSRLTSTDQNTIETEPTELCEKGLSRREIEVMEFVVMGLSNKVIARKLFVTERTIKFHCSNIYHKLKIKNRASLVHMMTAA